MTTDDAGPLRCTRCATPPTRETVRLDEAGVCNVCRAHEAKDTIDWDERAADLASLVGAAVDRRATYDCVVPLSGGKDSAFVLCHLMKRFPQVRPLCVMIDDGFVRDVAFENVAALTEQFGADLLTYRMRPDLVRRTMRWGLLRLGFVSWHSTSAIAAFPMRIALAHGVPLVLYSHGLAEYFCYPGRTLADPSEVMDEEYYGITTLQVDAEAMASATGLSRRELHWHSFPARHELKGRGVHGHFLSNFVPWDERRQAEAVEAETAWRRGPQEGVPAEYSYEKVDCDIVGTLDYLRFITRGFGRMTHVASLEARAGRLSYEQAVELIEAHDGQRPASLDRVLDFIGLDDEEFLDHATAHRRLEDPFDYAEVRFGLPLPRTAT